MSDVEVESGVYTRGTPTGTACEDTDQDGTPDVFDYDNDGDGVPDSLDSAPTTVLAGGQDSEGYTGFISQTLDFELDAFQANKPLIIDLELRPENPDHLWYAMNVLDWPENDKEGQIQHIHAIPQMIRILWAQL